MQDQQLLRYSRQIMLPDVDIAGQERFLQARVLLIGAGGLGCPVAAYLAAAGVGQLIVVDDDEVELSNLQRQILHGDGDIGVAKVESLAASLALINSDCRVVALQQRCDKALLQRLLSEVDLVIDACDNFATRFLLNREAVAAAVPLVSGAAITWQGQVSVFAGHEVDQPCYQCLYQPQAQTENTCAHNGVLAPVVGVIGSLMATEALKVLLDQDSSLLGRLQIWDAKQASWQSLNLAKDPDCAICGKGAQA